MTINFNHWLINGPKGSKFVYHIGFLANVPSRARREANDAWNAYQEGLVELVQKRIADGQYLYMAVKRRVRRIKK